MVHITEPFSLCQSLSVTFYSHVNKHVLGNLPEPGTVGGRAFSA